MDISPPKLGCINVYGKLSFITGIQANLTLTIQCMVVYGTVEILGDDGGPYGNF